MAHDILDTFRTRFDSVYGFLDKAVELTPDALWGKKIGGFYYWQQLVHVYGVIDSFCKEAGAPPTQTRHDADIIRLIKDGETAPTKADVLDLARQMVGTAHAFFERLTDEDLFAKNSGRTQRMGHDVTHLEALISLIAHGMYHVGICSMELRALGVKELP
ncbi:MAG: DinB family protein [Betaproteobacteria bacterium]|nr:DinB family protein [Betaproteobacteria bacterium]